jgi:hypothetical protein
MAEIYILKIDLKICFLAKFPFSASPQCKLNGLSKPANFKE